MGIKVETPFGLCPQALLFHASMTALGLFNIDGVVS